VAKTGPSCSICSHDKRHAIEIGLVHRVPARVLARRFDCSKDAIQRHGKNHLSPVQRAALLAHVRPEAIDLPALRESESTGLLASLVASRARLQQLAELSLELGDVRGAVAVESAVTNNLQLVAKLLGQLAVQHNVTHTSVLVSTDYLRLRQTLIAALKPFPDAAVAVGRALHAMEAEAARDITGSAHGPRTAPRLIEGTAEPVDVPPPARKRKVPSGRVDLPGQNELPIPPPPPAASALLPPPPLPRPPC
jgi:hypothetical protein